MKEQRVTKMKKTILTISLVLSFSSLVFAQGSGTPDQLRVMTDANNYLLVSGILQTNPVSSGLFGNARLATDASGNLLVVITGGSLTAPITIPANAITTTSTDALILTNTTASTAGVPVQISPRLRFRSHVWNTTAVAADNTDDMWLESIPISGTVPSGVLALKESLNGAAGFSTIQMGSFPGIPATYSAVWFGVSPTNTNYTFLGANDGSLSVLNANSGIVSARVSNVDRFNISQSGVIINPTNNAVPANPLLIQNAAKNATLLTLADAGTLTVGAGSFVTAANSNTVAPITLTHGTVLSSPTADTIENDAVSFYNTIDTTNGRRAEDDWNYFRLTGSGSGISGIADFFGATGSGIPLVANGIYEIEWHCYFSQATAGTATWTIVTATTALANLTAEYNGSNIAGITPVGANQTAAINVTSSSSTAFPASGSEANGATHYFVIHAILKAGNGASNTRLRLTMGAGTATPLINSYFKVRRLPGGNVGTFVS